MTNASLGRLAGLLERAVVLIALLALAYRVLVYGRVPRASGATWGAGDVIDYALALLLFVLALACAGCGVALSARAVHTHDHTHDRAARGRAWRPAVVGMTTFVAYYLVHPYLPVL